jgi:hypothetical protein
MHILKEKEILLYRDYADMLLQGNRIEDGCAFLQEQPAERRFQASLFFLLRLIDGCNDASQARQISYLIDEYGSVFSHSWNRLIFRKEVEMYIRLKDASKIATCMRKGAILPKVPFCS